MLTSFQTKKSPELIAKQNEDFHLLLYAVRHGYTLSRIPMTTKIRPIY